MRVSETCDTGSIPVGATKKSHMKTISLAIVSCLICFSASAQNYSQQIAEHRKHYKNEFVTDEHSPIKADDIKYLNFFDADEKFKTVAKVVLTPNEQPFDLPTYSGKTKKYIKYAELHFEVKNQKLKLYAYQSLKRVILHTKIICLFRLKTKQQAWKRMVVAGILI